ncbi:metallopeptidase MepB [Melampsora americana]|nr:metallopeptidase MepB [Melampsora americana]
MPIPNPPQPAPVWNHTATEIESIVKDTIEKSRKVMNQIGSLSPEDCTFDSVARPLADDDAAVANGEMLTFYQYVSPEESVRNAAVEADKLLTEYGIEVSSRMDVYKALLAAQKATDVSSLDPESKRLLERLILERTRFGLNLEEKDRLQFGELKKEISNLAIDFSKNQNEETGKIWFTPAELEGVPEDILSGFTKSDDGKLAMTFKTPDYVPVIKFAKNPLTRKRAFEGYENRTAMNVPIMDKILALRRKAAHILKKDNWASYVLEPKMAHDVKTVDDFLKDLREKITPIGLKERETLLELKRKEVEELKLDTDPNKLYIWDFRYYDRLYAEKTLDLKEDLVKEYFPVSVVVNVILETYQSLLSVKFFQVKDAKTWYPNASQWAVWDATAIEDGSANQGNGFLGYMHLDIEPRENKYGHAAVWGLIPGYLKADGSRNYPVAAMVANLAKETPQKPALLSHDDVVTFFHEMGHAFHQLCSKTKYARFHGTAVARDFVEAPSQMLENWCWTESQLSRMSRHYKRPDEQLPKELIDKIIASRDLNSGLTNLRQLFFGMLDMHVHTTPTADEDLTKTWCEMRKEISLVDDDGVYTPGQSTFGHIAGFLYYRLHLGYLYSQSFSADMFATIFEADPMSPKSGHLYRKEILEPGGSRDEMESLKAFLGRAPNNEAFMKRLLGNQSK